MVPLGTIEKVARVVDYERFYTPTLKDLVPGFEYEYVQLAFKNILVNAPSIGNTDRKPTCTYYQSWRKGVWGSPFSININSFKELMKKNNVRARKQLPTDYFKELLKNNPLSFVWRDLHIVVFPMKEPKEWPIYINGVSQRTLRAKPDSPLSKRWFVMPEGDHFKFELRYLLDQNFPVQPSSNTLYYFFDGVFKKSEDTFKNINENFTKGALEMASETSKVYDRPETKKQRKQAMLDIRFALKKGFREANSLVNNKHKTTDKHFEKKKSVEKTVREEVKAAIESQKQAERQLAEEKNHAKMDQLKMVCIRNTETNEVLRLPRYQAEKYYLELNTAWEYAPRSAWKRTLSMERAARKQNAEKNRITPSGPNRRDYRAAERQVGKRKPNNQYAQYQIIHGDYEWDEEKTYYDKKLDCLVTPVVEEQVIVLWPDPVYEYIPVFTKDKSKPIYNKMRKGENGEPEIIGYEEKPFMIYGYDEEGNKIEKQATKRVLARGKGKNLNERGIPAKRVTITRAKIAKKQKTILQHNFPSKIQLKRTELKAAIEAVKEKQKKENAESQ